jgi:hypothetical protein
VPGTPSCSGQTTALFNHVSGSHGASGNPRASAGAGYFLHPDTGPKKDAIIDRFCPVADGVE